MSKALILFAFIFSPMVARAQLPGVPVPSGVSDPVSPAVVPEVPLGAPAPGACVIPPASQSSSGIGTPADPFVEAKEDGAGLHLLTTKHSSQTVQMAQGVLEVIQTDVKETERSYFDLASCLYELFETQSETTKSGADFTPQNVLLSTFNEKTVQGWVLSTDIRKTETTGHSQEFDLADGYLTRDDTYLEIQVEQGAQTLFYFSEILSVEYNRFGPVSITREYLDQEGNVISSTTQNLPNSGDEHS